MIYITIIYLPLSQCKNTIDKVETIEDEEKKVVKELCKELDKVCKGKTKKGDSCTFSAKENGFCARHADQEEDTGEHKIVEHVEDEKEDDEGEKKNDKPQIDYYKSLPKTQLIRICRDRKV